MGAKRDKKDTKMSETFEMKVLKSSNNMRPVNQQNKNRKKVTTQNVSLILVSFEAKRLFFSTSKNTFFKVQTN